MILFAILAFAASLGCDRPKITGMEFDKIDTLQDPIQTFCRLEPILKKRNKATFVIVPLARYKIQGMVISKHYYSEGWDSFISPVDLLIVWGRLAEPEYRRPISFGHGARWYYYRWKEGGAVDPGYVSTHSSNNHSIPANENILRAIRKIGKKNSVVLEGFLVSVKGTYKGRPVSWSSSLSRTDSGDGSCELFYICKVRIETKIYE